jgi:hypothetical protein
MALRDVVTMLIAHWQDTLPHLQPGDLPLIADAVRRMETARGADQAANAAVTDLTTLLVLRLPAGHPVRDAIAAQPRLDTGPADLPAIASVLRALPGIETWPSQLSQSPTGAADRLGPSAEARLLVAPALTPEQVHDNGCDPERADLIRLPAGETVQLPAFQFGPDGVPVPVVAAINRLLGAAEDPWGVADWWLGRNAWLDAVPADVLGRIDDDLLTSAASAEFPEG